MMLEGRFIAVWRHAYDNHDEIRRSNSCRCLTCGERFAPSEIAKWRIGSTGQIVEKNPLGKRQQIETASAFCPYCCDPWVLGDASGYPLNDAEFMREVYLVGPQVFYDAPNP